jgi:ABC-2 type transport system permease protein
VSILNPRPAPQTIQRGGHLSPISSLAGMAIVSAGAALFGIPVLVAIRLDEPWLLPGTWGVLGVVGLVLYLATLPRTARLLGERREALLAAVCGDDL